MPYESEVSLGPVLATVLPLYGLALEPACRCAVCESQRAARLAQALHKKFGHGFTRTNRAINEPLARLISAVAGSSSRAFAQLPIFMSRTLTPITMACISR